MSEDIEKDDSVNVPSEEDDNTEDVEETSVEEQTEDTEPEYTESEKKLYARAKKAEAELKELKTQKPEPSRKEPPTSSGTGSLTTTVKELKAISDLEEDDAEYIVNYAEKFGITLSDARKDKDVQAILKVRAEERRTAEATATGASRRGSSKVSDDTLLERAESGDVPDDEESMKRIIRARMKRKG